MLTATAAKSDLEILRELNADYIRSVQTSDVARFDQILADDFVCTNPDGSFIDRENFLKQTARPVAISELAAHDVMIRVVGDCAVINARTSYRLPDGKAAGGRYTDVWARRNGQWVAIAAHVTRGSGS
jgi:ketosteroid isomerase-like protein